MATLVTTIYTFLNDTYLSQGVPGTNLDNIEGLKNTNFSLNNILGSNSSQYYPYLPYNTYYPYC